MPLPREWLDAEWLPSERGTLIRYADSDRRIRITPLPGDYSPYFFIRERDLSDASSLILEAGAEVERGDYVTLFGEPAVRIKCLYPDGNENSVKVLRDKLERKKIQTYESDIPFVKRVMIDYGIRQCRVDKIAYLDIEVEAEKKFPNPYDASQRILSVAVAGSDGSEYFLSSEDEREMLSELKRILRERYQVVTGWNWKRFDQVYLEHRALRLHASFGLFPLQDLDLLFAYQRCRVLMKIGGTGTSKLEQVARELLGIEHRSVKTIEDFKRLKEDKEFLRAYNMMDAKLVRELDARYSFCEPYLEISCSYPGIFIRESTFMTEVWDAVLLRQSLEQPIRIVYPRRSKKPGKLRGGIVVSSAPGVHRPVIGLDFKALYPSIIRTFRLSPEAIALYEAWKESGKPLDDWLSPH